MRSGILQWRILSGAAAVLLILLAAVTAASAAPARKGDNADRHWWERPKVVKMLQISEEQVGRIRQATRSDLRKSAELKKAFRQEQDTLDQLVAAEKLDEKAVLRQTEKLLSVLAGFTKIEAEIQFKALKELTAKQRRELMELVRTRKDWAMEKIRKTIPEGENGRSTED
ncbi:MAG TPA: periplasmic heavy metal sensor [Syntrophales bacterium]|nr:periplasmic heavy metal sensor [Syntrophales bacterium]